MFFFIVSFTYFDYIVSNETPNRSSQTSDSRDGDGRDRGESSPLRTRAAFLQNWNWEFIVRLNGGTCARGNAQHGINSETHQTVRTRWKEKHKRELTFQETLDFLCECHKAAPYTNKLLVVVHTKRRWYKDH